MNIKTITAPTSEPVTLAEAKDQLRITQDTEDDYIERLITVARQAAETQTGRALASATFELTMDRFPVSPQEIILPYPPLQSVTSIKYKDKDGAETTLDTEDYIADDDYPAKIVPAYNESFPSIEFYPVGAVKVRYDAGYTGEDELIVPEEIKQGILLLIADYYEYREDILDRGHIPKTVPFGIKALLQPYKVWWS